ncbi:hypothetical protein H5410_015083 [Solanum commersonii]|uniref:Uncharacterized protein n=1 Tax=Solanum commersonii TaxID=4109 RepID=A0A9J5ZT26_SOLCO|nr:hypothetical protein H5410_015083 [Solanum commersonii]
MILNTRRENGNFWKLVEKYPIHPRVLEVIILCGLYGVYKVNRPAIDRSEATITLQDVKVLYGLPVNGDLVLGFIPSHEDFKTNSLKGAAFNTYMLSQL